MTELEEQVSHISNDLNQKAAEIAKFANIKALLSAQVHPIIREFSVKCKESWYEIESKKFGILKVISPGSVGSLKFCIKSWGF